MSEYLKMGLELISILDRKEIENYFFGEIDTTEDINNEMRA